MKKVSSESVELGLRLKEFRLRQKLSVETVAQRIGVAPSTYREWERGRAITGNPYPKIAEVLGVGVYKILGIEEESKDILFNCLYDLEKSIQLLKKHI